MITCTFRGQLGNQMFQVATAIAHAIRMNTAYAFPERSGKRGQFPFMFPELSSISKEDLRWEFKNHREPRFGVYDPIPLENNLNLQGYWQSEKYFKEYRKEIIELFNIPSFEIKRNVISLHIRRGDSLKFIDKLPQPTDKYLNEALEYFPNHQVLVFSDDLQWCKEKFKGERFIFDEGDSDAKQTLGRMASCENQIIVNSTFSWMAAWLNKNPNKTVICPHSDSWFGDNWKHKLSAQDIPCDDWIKIKY